MPSSSQKFQQHRSRVLQVSYLCDPISSMESRLGWYRALATADSFDTTVICEEANREKIENYINANGDIPGLEFRFVRAKPFNDVFALGYQAYYQSYHDWQRQVFELAKQLHADSPFDLTHQIGLCGYREPGYLWKLDVPFFWGPIGGTQNLPWRFLSLLSIPDAIIEVARALTNNWQLRCRTRVKNAAAKATKIYAANTRTLRDFETVHGRRAELQLETGLPELPTKQPRQRKPREPLRILWSGRFRPWKALPLLLYALEGLDQEIDFELRLIGYQTSETEYRRLTTRLNLDKHVTWLGWPPYAETLSQYEWADVFAFTSLRDTSGTGLLEALAYGCPIIGVNHQGAADIMTEDCATLIPVTTPSEAISAFREAVLDLAKDHDKLSRKSHAAVDRAKDFLWSELGNKMVRDYQRVLGERTSESSNIVATTR